MTQIVEIPPGERQGPFHPASSSQHLDDQGNCSHGIDLIGQRYWQFKQHQRGLELLTQYLVKYRSRKA